MPVAAHWQRPFYGGSTGFPGQNLSSPNGMVHGTWLSDILPFLEGDPAFTTLQAAYSQNSSAGQTAIHKICAIASYICPSDPSSGSMGKGPNTNGYGFGSTNYYGNVMVMRINNAPRDILGAMPDGSSNCVMIAERYQNCGDPHAYYSWPGWGETTAFPDGDPLDTPMYGANYAKSLGASGGLWVDPNSTTPIKGPGSWNQQSFPNFNAGAISFQSRPTILACDLTLLQSGHTGVMVVGLGDGSAKTVSDSISVATWKAANDPRDGVPLGPDW
jgi:hypothetical protein